MNLGAASSLFPDSLAAALRLNSIDRPGSEFKLKAETLSLAPWDKESKPM